MEGAELRSPREPWISAFSEEDLAARKEMVHKIIALFVEAGYTYDQAYMTLEAVNDTLLFSSRYVSIPFVPKD